MNDCFTMRGLVLVVIAVVAGCATSSYQGDQSAPGTSVFPVVHGVPDNLVIIEPKFGWIYPEPAAKQLVPEESLLPIYMRWVSLIEHADVDLDRTTGMVKLGIVVSTNGVVEEITIMSTEVDVHLTQLCVDAVRSSSPLESRSIPTGDPERPTVRMALMFGY